MRKIFVIFVVLLVFLSSMSLWVNYSSELRQAYNWAYENGITTMNTIEWARMNDWLVREEMAKMISNYAVDILWKVPDASKSCCFLDSNINPDLVQYVTESCQLWLMWQWVTSFRPKDFVTRAEFWTVLSRMLWGDEYEWWELYYENHLKALNINWIMNNISSPFNNEIRWYVMLMLMRSVWWVASDIINNNQISDVLGMLD